MSNKGNVPDVIRLLRKVMVRKTLVSWGEICQCGVVMFEQVKRVAAVIGRLSS